MTKTYKVLKDFPSSDGGLEHKVGKTYKPSQSETRTKALERLGYIKEIPKEPKTVWDLEVGELCWLRTSHSSCFESTPVRAESQIWNNEIYQVSLRMIGGVFLTKEECDKSMERDRVREILLKDAKWFKPDWKNFQQPKWYVSYCCDTMEFEIDTSGGADAFCEIYFATEEDAKKSIEKHPDEWKTYLGIDN